MANNEQLFIYADIIQVPDKRKMIKQLPGVVQTQTLQNFFSATVDHLFQPVQSERVAGYIGQKPSYYDPSKDFYVPELSQERSIYQLEPCATTKNGNSITNAIFFADLLQALRSEGANITNQNRLFEQDYYSWCPPINLDMLINYSQYYWLENGPEPILVKTATDIDTQLVGKTAPDAADLTFGDSGSVKITSGMRIILLNDSNPAYNGKTISIEGVGKSIFIVEFNETDLNSTPWDLFPWDRFDWDLSTLTSSDYIIMERGCKDTNSWARNNHWYHKDVLLASNTSLFTNINKQASRPIICFERNLELYNYGDFRRSSVDLIDVDSQSMDPFNNFHPPQGERWVLLQVDGTLQFINENNGISYQEQIRTLKAQYPEQPEKVQIIKNGSTILFTAIIDSDVKNNKPYLVKIDNPVSTSSVNSWDSEPLDIDVWEESDPDISLSYSEIITGFLRFTPVTDSQDGTAGPNIGDIIKIKFGEYQGKEMWFDGHNWIIAQEKKDVNQEPLFTLYDANPNGNVGVRLDDETRYPGSSFKGNKIFGFLLNTDNRTVTDQYIGKKLTYNEWGEIKYQDFLDIVTDNDLVNTRYTYTKSKYNNQPISGYYFWKIKSDEFYGNNWWTVNETSKQFIVDNFIVTSDQPIINKQTFIGDGVTSSFILNHNVPTKDYLRVVVKDSTTNTNIFYKMDDNSNKVEFYDIPSVGQVITFYHYSKPKSNLEFIISQEPDVNLLLNKQDNLMVYINGKVATPGEHYLLVNQREFDATTPISKIAILQTTDSTNISIMKNTNITVKSYSPLTPDLDINGHYEIPNNLAINPDWSEVSYITSDQFLPQFSAIIKNQPNFSGIEYEANNWRDTIQDRSLGRTIIQHTSPLLRLMISNANDDLDYMKSSRFVETEYTRFKNKFLQKLTKFWIKDFIHVDITSTTEAQRKIVKKAAIDSIMKEINLGKVYKVSPFSYSNMAGMNWFIPPTPSFLGLFPTFKPEKYVDDTYLTPIEVIQCHDGSLLKTFGDYRDEIILELETLIYESIPLKFRDGNPHNAFQYKRYFPGKFRTQLSEYTREEINTISQPMFERWVSENQQSYRPHTGFDYTNLWTYNWSTSTDNLGNPVPGHWRGIFNWFFDTDRPHTHPWEMLGFSESPDWWETYYGPVPYTRGNMNLWEDLEKGIIREGSRAGIDPYYARPGLLNILPVDEYGHLIDPWTAGMLRRKPNYSEAEADWVYGDGSPVETKWKKTSQFPFAMSQIGYLIKPARWMEQCWNPLDDEFIYDQKQLIRKSTLNRSSHSKFTVHGETYNGQLVINYGYQQWITDRLLSNNKSPGSNFGDVIRALGVQLGYKVGGFCNPYTFYADNILGSLPAENINQFLYRSPSVREEIYSGVIIEWTGRSYKVSGYDSINPVFKIIPSDVFGKKVSHDVGGTVTIQPPEWQQGILYNVGDTVMFNYTYYKAIKTNQSTTYFDPTVWVETTLSASLSGTTVFEYLEPIYDRRIETIPYGYEFSSRQDTFDFLVSYQRYLISRGWAFDDIDETTTNEKIDWILSGRLFVQWSLERDKNVGTFIKLSPYAIHAQYKSSFGSIQSIEQVLNGVYSLLDENGFIIEPHDIISMRSDDVMDINLLLNDRSLSSVRLFVSEIEHVILFDNVTVFNDLIFDPLFNQRQVRLKVDGTRTLAWNGRIDAPGYIISDNLIYPNFEKTAKDFLRLYGIEDVVDNVELQNRARHLIGYQERPYLQNLLLSPTTNFQFYQGMIHAKGSRGSMTKLFRSEYVSESRDFKIFEEWAFKLGDYGAIDTNPTMEFYLDPLNGKQITEDPQLVTFNELQNSSSLPAEPSDLDDRYDNIISLYDYFEDGKLVTPDKRWLRRPNGIGNLWEKRDFGFYASDIPNAGPIKLDEVDYFITNTTELLKFSTNLRVDKNKSLTDGERLWIYDTGCGDWSVYRVTGVTSNSASVTSVSLNASIDQDSLCGLDVSTVTLIPNQKMDLTSVHSLVDGQYFVVVEQPKYPLGQYESLLGTYKAEIGTHGTMIYYSSPNTISNTWTDGTGPQIFSYMPMRYPTLNSVTGINPNTGWKSKNNNYIFELNSNVLAVDSNGHYIGSLKLIDSSKINSTTILGVSLELVTPTNNIHNEAFTVEIGNVFKNNYYTFTTPSLVSNDLVQSFTLNDNIAGTGLRQIIIGSTPHNFNAKYKIGTQIVGKISNIQVDITHAFAQTVNPVTFSIGTLADPNKYIVSGSVNITVINTVVFDTLHEIYEPEDIYVFYDLGNIPDQLGSMNVAITYKNEIDYTTNVLYTTNDDLMMYYNFGTILPSDNAMGTFRVHITIKEDNSDIIWVDDARTSYEIQKSITPYWASYIPAMMETTISYNDQKYFNGNKFLTASTPRNLFNNEDRLINKQITRIEVEVQEAFTNTSTVFNGSFDYSDLGSANTTVINGQSWMYNEINLVGETSNAMDGVVTDLQITIASQGSFVRPTTIKLFTPNTSYAAGALICQNGLIEKARVSFTSGATYNQSDWIQMPKLQMMIGTMSNPNIVLNENIIDLATANVTDIPMKVEVISPNVGSPEALYVFYNFNQYNINTSNTSAVTISGTIKSFVKIGHMSGNNFGFAPIVLTDELKTTGVYTYAPKYYYDSLLKTNNLQIGIVGHDTSTGKIIVRVTTWDQTWVQDRVEIKKISPNQIESALLYNIETDRIERYLTYYDLYKGIVPGNANREIYYRTLTDPAKYTHGTGLSDKNIDPEQAWGMPELGRVWWDLSTTRALEYEIGDDLQYSWKNWGKTVPNSTIDIYEWVRSPVAPKALAAGNSSFNASSYSGQLDGIVKDADNPFWVESKEFDKTVGTFKTFYYFWMKNKNTVPAVPFRNVSVSQVAAMISNPSGQDIPWFAPINENSILLGSLKQYYTNGNIVLQINWKTGTNDGNIHRQWVLLRENDPMSQIDTRLWNKMRDSLTGWDSYSETVVNLDGSHSVVSTPKQVPEPNLTIVQKYGTLYRPRQTWFKTEADNSPSRMARKVLVQKLNSSFMDRTTPFVDDYADFVESLNVSSPMPAARFKPVVSQNIAYTNTTSPITLKPSVIGYLSLITITVTTMFVQGSPTISVGTDANPELFVPRSSVNLKTTGTFIFGTKHLLNSKTDIKIFTDFNNSIAGEFKIAVTTVEANLDGYDYVVGPTNDGVTGREVRDLLLYNPGLNDGDRVLVTNDIDVAGFWSFWEWQKPASSSVGSFVMLGVQTYNINVANDDFIGYVDWYRNDSTYQITSNSKPLFYFDTIEDMAAAIDTWQEGSLVAVNNVDGRWSWYIRSVTTITLDLTTGWVLVARQNGSIALNSSFYNNTTVFAPKFKTFSEWTIDYDTIVARDGSNEIVELLDILQTRTDEEFKLFQNQLFFTMVKFVLSQQHLVDWIFKTSYIYITGLNQQLEQNPVVIPDNTESILDYIKEVKPYHTKIREFIRSLATPLEVNTYIATDFDNPSTWDAPLLDSTFLGTYRLANPSDSDAATADDIGPYDEKTVAGQTGLTTKRPWNEWWAAYSGSVSLANDATGMRIDYKNNDNRSPNTEHWKYLNTVRTYNMEMTFDRVQTDLDTLMAKPFDQWTTADHTLLANSGVVAKMFAQYSDFQENWVYYKSLISGSQFRGTVMEGGELLNYDIIDFENNQWDTRPWSVYNWDETQYSDSYPTTQIKKLVFSYTDFTTPITGVPSGKGTWYKKRITKDFVGIVTDVIFLVGTGFKNVPFQQITSYVGTDAAFDYLVGNSTTSSDFAFENQDLTFSGTFVHPTFTEINTKQDLNLYVRLEGTPTAGEGFVVVKSADKVQHLTYTVEIDGASGQSGSKMLVAHSIGNISTVKVTVLEPFSATEIPNLSVSVGTPYNHSSILDSSLVNLSNYKQPVGTSYPGEVVYSIAQHNRTPVNLNVYYDFLQATAGKIKVEINIDTVKQKLSAAGPLEPYYDLGVSGGTLEGIAKGVIEPAYDPLTDNDPNILIEGGRFIQPYIEQDRPEELVRSFVNDIAAVTVNTNSSFGSPMIHMQRFKGTGSPGPFNIFSIGQSISAIIVHKNNKLLIESEDYTIDWISMTITFLDSSVNYGSITNPSTTVDYGSITEVVTSSVDYGNVSDITDSENNSNNTNLNDDYLVTTFTTGGAQVLQEATFIAPTDYVLSNSIINESVWANTGVNKNAIMVTVNGYIPSSFDFDIIENKVIGIVPEPNIGDRVQVTLFDSDVYSVVRVENFIVGSDPVVYPYDLNLSWHQQSTTPASSAILVYNNGYRLLPPDVEYFDGNGVNNIFVIPAPKTLTNLTAIINGVTTTDYKIRPFSDVTINLLYTITISGADYLANGYVEIPFTSITGSVWDIAKEIPKDALFIIKNNQVMQDRVVEHGNRVRLIRFDEQPIASDTITIEVYDSFVYRLPTFVKDGIHYDFTSLTANYTFESNIQTSDQLYVYVDGIVVYNYFISTPNIQTPSIRKLTFFATDSSWDMDNIGIDASTWDGFASFMPGKSIPTAVNTVKIVVLDTKLNNHDVEIVFDVIPPMKSLIEVTIMENYDYIVNGDIVEIQSQVQLTEKDELQVISFSEDSSFGIRTEIFEGTVDSTYDLSQMPYSSNAIWATVDRFDMNNPTDPTKGMDQYQTKDFKVSYKMVDEGNGVTKEVAEVKFGIPHARLFNIGLGWSINPGSELGMDQQYTWDKKPWEDPNYTFEPDSSKTVGQTIPEPAGLVYEHGWEMDAWEGGSSIERDRVWITSFSGTPNVPAVSFRLFKTNNGTWEHIRISDSYKTYLNKPIYTASRTIELVANPEIPVSNIPVDLLDIPANKPGVIWIENERIEYKNMSMSMVNNRPVYTLSNITRGSLGTPSMQYLRYDRQHYYGDGLNKVFIIDQNIKNNFDNLAFIKYQYIVDKIVDGFTYYKIYKETRLESTDYTIYREAGVWYVKFNTALPQAVIANQEPFYPIYNVNSYSWDSNVIWGNDVWDQTGTIPNPNPTPQPTIVNTYYPTVVMVGFNNEATYINDVLQYEEGTMAINGAHIIPGGYHFEVNPSGIQRSESEIAKYLIAEPGTF
jgi:hypothetical protein